MSAWAIVLACGKEQELNSGVDTAFLALGRKPVLAYSLQTLQDNDLIDGIVIVIRKERVESTLQMAKAYGLSKVKSLVGGAGQRLSNLKKAYAQVPEGVTAIVVHEASRPFVSDEVVTETVKAGKRYGVSVAAVKSPDSVKLAEKGQKVSKTLDRNTIWLAQSPQAFKRDAFEKLLKGTKLVDDESALLEKTRQDIHLVVSSAGNMKIRTSEDLQAAIALAGAQ
jgi:2-C-methyl-D-erythritol 4-phosphate cytidylyltransferase